MDRKRLAVMSSMIGLISKIVTAFLAFICRKIFLLYLGTDFLGINSTLVQVLDTLSLGELGFQTAIIFQLYKPLSENDHKKISQILMLLKKIYNFLGIGILCVGILVMPFLNKIITKVNVEFSFICLIYFIMLMGTASTYFLSYHKALIQADQRMYINNLIDSVFQIIFTIAKLMSITMFRSFLLYVILGVICNIGMNVVSYIYYKIHYKWINVKETPNKEIIDTLIINTKDVFIGKMGAYVYNSTDNLVISAFVGTSLVGIVGNYTTITNTIKMLIFGITAPIQPMLGNFFVTKEKEDAKKTLVNYGFIRFAMALFLIVPTITLSNMFVEIFYGLEYVLTPIIGILLSADLLIVCLQGAVGEMIDALGYFKQEKYLYLFYAFFNLFFSCIGAYLWGVIPIFIATIIAQIFAWIWRSIIAYKNYFKSKIWLWTYWKSQIKYIVFFVGMVGIIFILEKLIYFDPSFLSFIIYGVMEEIIILIFFVLYFGKTDEFQYLKLLLKKILLRREK